MKIKYSSLLFCFFFLFVSLEMTNACSLSNLKSCDRAGLVSLIKEIIIEKQKLNDPIVKSKFSATEIIANNLPNSIEFWTQAYCPGDGTKYDYPVPKGYNVVSCNYGVTGSHSGCKTCVMSKIVLSENSDEDLKKLFGAESIIRKTDNCVDFTLSEADLHEKALYYELSDGISDLESYVGDYLIYNDITGDSNKIFDNYIGVCKKDYFNSIFSEQFFIDKFININKISNLEQVSKKYNKSNNGLSPEQMAFLIANLHINFKDGIDSQNSLTIGFNKEIQDCIDYFGGACPGDPVMGGAQDIPENTFKISKATIKGNKAVVFVFFYPWGQDGEQRWNFVFEDNNWKLDSVEK